MRILLVGHAPLHGAGAGTYLTGVSRQLAAAGHHATTLTPGPQDRTLIAHGVTHRMFRLALPGLLPGQFPTFSSHPRSGISYAALDSRQLAAYRHQYETAISRIARVDRAEIVHAQHLFLVTIAAAASGRPVVTTAHGTELHLALRNPAWLPAVRHAATRADRIVYVSRYVRDVAAGLLPGLPAGAATVIHNGYDPAVFHPRRVGRERALRIAAGGRLAPEKRIDVAIEAVALLAAARPNEHRVHLVVAGDGPLRADLHRHALRTAGCRITFAGLLPARSFAELLRTVDVFVIPSVNEPFGLTALEAAACGTQVLGSATGGLGEFISPQVGTLMAGWEPADWACVLRKLLGAPPDPVRRREISVAVKHLTWAAHVEKLVAEYRRVASIGTTRTIALGNLSNESRVRGSR